MLPALRVALKSYHVKSLQNVAGRYCSLARANILEETIDRKREEAKLGGGIKRIKSQHSKVSHDSYIFLSNSSLRVLSSWSLTFIPFLGTY